MAEAPEEARYPAWMADRAVPRHAFDDPEASRLLASNQPVVQTGCPLAASLTGRWDFETLSELCGPHELGVHTVPPAPTSSPALRPRAGHWHHPR